LWQLAFFGCDVSIIGIIESHGRRERASNSVKSLISDEIVRDSLDASAADPDLRARGSRGNSRLLSAKRMAAEAFAPDAIGIAALPTRTLHRYRRLARRRAWSGISVNTLALCSAAVRHPHFIAGCSVQTAEPTLLPKGFGDALLARTLVLIMALRSDAVTCRQPYPGHMVAPSIQAVTFSHQGVISCSIISSQFDVYVTTILRRSVPMSVLTIASSKGGPGKTTLCQVLAGSLAGACRMVVLDADPTQALSRWASSAYEGPAFETIAETDETRLAHLISMKAETADLVLIDTAGFGNRAATVAMTSADAVLVPTLAGEADITEAEKTIRLVDGLARAARRDIPARVVFNRVRRTSLARHAGAELEKAKLMRLDACLSDLVAYGEMSYSGRVPLTGAAGVEVAALLGELRKLGWITTPVRNGVGS
jgi:chromosome partitioning protein